jgi:hypothetical protein
MGTPPSVSNQPVSLGLSAALRGRNVPSSSGREAAPERSSRPSAPLGITAADVQPTWAPRTARQATGAGATAAAGAPAPPAAGNPSTSQHMEVESLSQYLRSNASGFPSPSIFKRSSRPSPWKGQAESTFTRSDILIRKHTTPTILFSPSKDEPLSIFQAQPATQHGVALSDTPCAAVTAKPIVYSTPYPLLYCTHKDDRAENSSVAAKEVDAEATVSEEQDDISASVKGGGVHSYAGTPATSLTDLFRENGELPSMIKTPAITSLQDLPEPKALNTSMDAGEATPRHSSHSAALSDCAREESLNWVCCSMRA